MQKQTRKIPKPSLVRPTEPWKAFQDRYGSASHHRAGRRGPRVAAVQSARRQRLRMSLWPGYLPPSLIVPPINDGGPDGSNRTRHKKKLPGRGSPEDRDDHDADEQHAGKSLHRNLVRQDTPVIPHTRKQCISHAPYDVFTRTKVLQFGRINLIAAGRGVQVASSPSACTTGL